jgi:hypothetical protein
LKTLLAVFFVTDRDIDQLSGFMAIQIIVLHQQRPLHLRADFHAMRSALREKALWRQGAMAQMKVSWGEPAFLRYLKDCIRNGRANAVCGQSGVIGENSAPLSNRISF